MKMLIIILGLLILSTNLNAAFFASNKKDIDLDQPTHLIIVGHPDSLGELFIYSALTKAKIYAEKSDKAQVLILGRNQDREFVKNAGFHIIGKTSGILKSETIHDAVKKLEKISSIDIFSHSNPFSGATLDYGTFAISFLDEKDKLWNSVATKVNQSSFVFIYGCNTGLKFAPTIATKLKIAVFAAITSTDFQYIYHDSFWAFDTNSDKQSKSDKNILNFSRPEACGKYCTRMKPTNSIYRGHWGDWTAGGYPAYKLFCGSNDNEKCELGALEGVLTYPTNQKVGLAKLSLNNFKDHLVDFMCPHSYSIEKQNQCKEELENSLTAKEKSIYSPFDGKTLVCDRVRCSAKFVCSAYNIAFNPDKCLIESETEENSTAFTDEFKYFISIYNKNYVH